MSKAQLRVGQYYNQWAGRYYTRRKLYLDHLYLLNDTACRLVKVTRKGFNFVCLETGKHLCRQLLYSKELRSFKEIPECIEYVNLEICSSIRLVDEGKKTEEEFRHLGRKSYMLSKITRRCKFEHCPYKRERKPEDSEVYTIY